MIYSVRGNALVGSRHFGFEPLALWLASHPLIKSRSVIGTE